MANSTTKYGLKPYGPYLHPPREYRVDPSAAAIGMNSPVKPTANGGVVIDTAGSAISVGVAVSFFDAAGQFHKTYPGGSLTGWTALVLDDPDQEFMIKCTTALTAADVGTNADITIGAISPMTGIDGSGIDTVAAATAGVRVVGLAKVGDNAWGANQDVVVRFNEHFYRTLAGI